MNDNIYCTLIMAGLPKLTRIQCLKQPLSLFDNHIGDDQSSVTDTTYRIVPNGVENWNIEATIRALRDAQQPTGKIYNRLTPPPNDDGWRFGNEAHVQGVLCNTLFATIESLFQNTDHPIRIGQNAQYTTSGEHVVAEADFLAFRRRTTADRNRLLLPIEAKKPLSSDTDLRPLYRAGQVRATHIVQQIVGYMYLNHVVYGLITSYQDTYACHLRAERCRSDIQSVQMVRQRSRCHHSSVVAAPQSVGSRPIPWRQTTAWSPHTL